MLQARIFVHLTSGSDRECPATLRDLFAKARHPQRVTVGIGWQGVPDRAGAGFDIGTRAAQVRMAKVHSDPSQGPGRARLQAQRLWQGEDYVLQIEGPLCFDQDWDVVLLEQLAQCDSEQPVLTLSPPVCTAGEAVGAAWFARLQPAVQFIQGFRRDGLLDFSSASIPPGVHTDRPMPTAACAAGFIFGPSSVLRDVPADPEVDGIAEAQSLAVRLWTAGYDLYSPRRMPLGRLHASSVETHDRLHDDLHHHERALQRLGARRSLADYQAYSGVDFAARVLADHARTFPYVHLSDARHPPGLPDETLQPVAGTHVFLLGEEALLFREERGEFHRLNDSAAFAWCAREEGYTWSRIATDQAAARQVDLDTTTREIAALAARWLAQGLLRQPDAPAATLPEAQRAGPRVDGDPPAAIEHQYELLGVSMRVRYGDRDLEQRIHPLFAHLQVHTGQEPADTFTVASQLGQFYLFCNHTLLSCGANPAALGPPLKWKLLERAIERQDVIVQIHAGAVESHGCLALLPGHSGNGKTMLTARLVAAGARYFTDEVVLLERGSAQVRPTPISLCIKTRGLPLLEPHFPGLTDLTAHDREDGLVVRYLPPPPGSRPAAGHAAQPRLLVFRRYVADVPQTLRRLPQTEAFGRLMDYCVAIPKPLSLHDASALVACLGAMDCYELTGSQLDQDAETVLGLCRDIGLRNATTGPDDRGT